MELMSTLRRWIYSLSSIVRPLELQKTTHKILLGVLPIAAGVAAFFAYRNEGTIREVIEAGAFGLFGGYGVWALVRELLGEDDFLALFGVPAAVYAVVTGRELSLWLLFAAVAMTRMVGRSVGKATWFDSAVVCALALTAMMMTENMLFWFPCMLAFALDAHTQGGEKRQWLFALLCAGGGVYFDYKNLPLMRELGFATLPPWSKWLLLLLALTLLLGWFTRPTSILSEKEKETVTVGQLRAALLIGLLCALTPMFRGYLGLLMAGFLWAGVALAGAGVLWQGVQKWLLPKSMTPSTDG